MKRKDSEVLAQYFRFPPQTVQEAKNVIHNANQRGHDFPPAVYAALQNLLIKDMGGKTSPKKRDRIEGKKRSKKRKR